MMTEIGTLNVGIDYDGKVHREFELRPQLVRDSIEAVEEDRAKKNESYLGLIVLSKQIVRLGEIPKEAITPDLLMGMYDIDLVAINEASGRLAARLRSFRKGDEGEKKGHPRPGEDRL